jgi:hypothetical protein
MFEGSKTRLATGNMAANPKTSKIPPNNIKNTINITRFL